VSETQQNRPIMTVTPEVGLVDTPLHVELRGVPPDADVTIRARLLDHGAVPWSSYATYRSNATGTVDLTRDAPISGTYAGADGEGLISSLAVDSGFPSRPFDNSSLAALRIEFSAEIGTRQVARVSAHRLYVGAGVQVTTLRERGLSGMFFQPLSDEPRPGIIVLGGSSGKLLFASQTAALLASHGYPSLALGYFGLDGLPPHLIEIPIAYVESALEWLASQNGVASDALGVVGRSRGAELALLLGSRFPAIRSVVAFCPSSILWNGLRGDTPVDISAWQASGRPLPFLSLMAPRFSDLRSRVLQNAPVALTPLFEAGLDGPVPPKCLIPVENTNGSILLISGDEDRMWPSSRMGDQIVERLETHRHRFHFRHCRYPGAGHYMRTPGVPTSVLRGSFELGGNGAAQAAANRAAWAETLAFLETSLCGRSNAAEPATIGGTR
jgi:dienelactone hydrolase